MKRFLVLVIVFCVAMVSAAYAAEVLMTDDQAVIAKKSILTENQKPLTAFDFDSCIENIEQSAKRSKRAAWFSSDSNDLSPIKGTTWIFTYQIGTSVYADVVTFGTQTATLSGGTVGLGATSSSIQGSVFYTDMLQGGRGFAAVIDSGSYTSYYYFAINNNVPQGVYILKNDSTGTATKQYPLTGIKFGSDIGSNNAVSIGDTLNLSIPLAVYNGSKYGFVLNYVSIPTDPNGYYWKMDLNTFTVK